MDIYICISKQVEEYHKVALFLLRSLSWQLNFCKGILTYFKQEQNIALACVS